MRQAQEAADDYHALVERVLTAANDESLSALDSPIFASLLAISRSSYFSSPNRTLWAITDGLEASETARFGQISGDAPPYEVFASQRRFEAVRPRSFEGTHVNLLLVESVRLPQPGLEHITYRERDNFWVSYFTANGADTVEMTHLRHGAG